jgi:hypothetical protein
MYFKKSSESTKLQCISEVAPHENSSGAWNIKWWSTIFIYFYIKHLLAAAFHGGLNPHRHVRYLIRWVPLMTSTATVQYRSPT